MIEYSDQLINGKRYFGIRNVELYGSDTEVFFGKCLYNKIEKSSFSKLSKLNK